MLRNLLNLMKSKSKMLSKTNSFRSKSIDITLKKRLLTAKHSRSSIKASLTTKTLKRLDSSKLTKKEFAKSFLFSKKPWTKIRFQSRMTG
jgi:hypothetical protein